MTIPMKWLGLGDLFLLICRKVLYWWVRTQVFPEDLKALSLDPNKPVCYVMQTRSIADLLVVDTESKRGGLPRAMGAMLAAPGLRERRSLFFLTRADKANLLVQNRFAYSPRLLRLVQAAKANPELDVQIVPVTVLWGRSPDKESSLFKILLADSWATPGSWKKFIAVLVHGRNTLVRFSPPISLREFAQEADCEDRALRKLSRVLRVHFRRQREVAIGPDLSHRRTLVNDIVRATPVKDVIEQEVAAGRLKREDAYDKARGYAHEIAADYAYPIIRALDVVLTWLWNSLYDGVNVHHFDRVAQMAQDHEIIYVPSHRSHIDYLLLSYVIHNRGLTPPHIAAGSNLNMPVVGSILRRGGAFFLRRSFKGNDLYAAVFNEYIHLITSKGFAIEYFIEGGRSRTGRLLAPRTGMLSMTLRSYLRDSKRPIAFIPCYIGYEKLMEGATYVGELQGKPKQKESIFGLLMTLRKIKKTFGKVHLNFGEPIVLGELLDQEHANWRYEAVPEEDKRPWMGQAVDRLADEIVTRINASAVVNPFNLVSLALLSTPKHAIDEQLLAQQIDLYLALLREAPYGQEVKLTELDGRGCIAYAEGLNAIQRRKHPLGDIVYLHEESAVLLTYQRNNTVHLFALPALISCLFLNNGNLERTQVHQLVRTVYPFLKAELFLRWNDEQLAGEIDRQLGVLVAQGLLIDRGHDLICPSPNSAEYAKLDILAQAVRHALQRFYITVTLLTQQGKGKISQKGLEDLCQLLAQRLSMLHEFNAPEFFDKASFRSFILALIELGLIRVEDGRLTYGNTVSDVSNLANHVLTAEIRQTILQMTKLGEEDIANAIAAQESKEKAGKERKEKAVV